MVVFIMILIIMTKKVSDRPIAIAGRKRRKIASVSLGVSPRVRFAQPKKHD